MSQWWRIRSIIKLKQQDIVSIDFDSSKGYEVQKSRAALVMSRNEYNMAANRKIQFVESMEEE